MTETQTVEVSGSHSQVVTVGRDLIMAKTYVQEKPEFFEPDLDRYKPPAFATPKNIRQLVDIVQRQHLLVLAGSPEINKAPLARHVAWYLCDLLAPGAPAVNGRMPVLEWHRGSSGSQRLVAGIREAKDRTIFVLSQILPQDVNFDLPAVQESARAGEHFVILSTDSPVESWKQDKSVVGHLWCDLSPEDVYSPDDLANVLTRRLIEARALLPPGFLPDEVRPEKPLVGELLVRDVAAQLRTPDNVAVFVQLLCAERETPGTGTVSDLIALAQDNTRTLQQWYHAILSPREQLLALGLSLFDGLFDDQFFAALEHVVEDTWRYRDPSLRALDYCDLDNLRTFFDLVPVDRHVVKIESRLTEQRRAVFRVAWNNHRRQILSALPVMTALIKNSVDWRSLDSELYGTRVRRDQLRNAIGESLSDIGLISVKAAQNALVALAADDNLGVQAVAARALARWRAYGHDEELFDTLHSWQYETSIINAVSDVLEGREEKEGGERSEGAQAYIRATMALTLSYAGSYDPPNSLSAEICSLLERLAKDQSPLVRDRLRNHTLPMIVPSHAAQLRDILKGMTRYIDLIPTIGASLASAYERSPDAVLDIVAEWHRDCREMPAGANSKTTQREALLAAIAMTYGYIDYERGVGQLTADDAFERLQDILRDKHPFVRGAVVLAVSLQAKSHFDRVEPMLRGLVSEVPIAERSDIVRVLRSVYLQQRGELEGGEDTLEVGGRRYAIWVDGERPLTAVEGAMLRWVQDSGNPTAQQIATRAFIVFAEAFDKAEEKCIRAIRADRMQRSTMETGERTELPHIARGPRRGGIFVDRFVPWLVTLGNASVRPIIGNLLPETVVQSQRSIDTVEFVLKKWKNLSGRLKLVALRLRRGLMLVQNKKAIVTVGGIGLLVSLCVCSCLIMSMVNN